MSARTLAAYISQKVSFISKLLDIVKSNERADFVGIDSSAELTISWGRLLTWRLGLTMLGLTGLVGRFACPKESA